MSEIVIKIKNWKELHEAHYLEQFEVFIDGEKIPRLEQFSITVENATKLHEEYNPADRLSYTVRQHIDYESWEKP